MTATRDQWNGARFTAGSPAGHYESWFQRANDASGRRAWWIRYTIFSPAERPGDAVGELWAIAFDKQTGKIVAVKDVVPIDECRFAKDALNVAIGDARLDDEHLRGSATANGHTIAWDLRYGGGRGPLLLLPEALYAWPVPRSKSLVGRPLARFTGTLTVDGERLVIDDWVGSQNHNWGSKHTDRYAWGQVCGFDEDPDAFLEVATARLKLGPVWTPWMSPVVLIVGGETLGWNALPRAIRADGHYDLRRREWTIATESKLGQLAVRMSAPPEHFVALRYGNPPGGAKTCLNSKIATCEVTLVRNGKTTRLTSHRAAFELLEDQALVDVSPEV